MTSSDRHQHPETTPIYGEIFQDATSPWQNPACHPAFLCHGTSGLAKDGLVGKRTKEITRDSNQKRLDLNKISVTNGYASQTKGEALRWQAFADVENTAHLLCSSKPSLSRGPTSVVH